MTSQRLSYRSKSLAVTATHIQYGNQIYHYRDLRSARFTDMGIQIVHSSGKQNVLRVRFDRDELERILDRNFWLYQQGYTAKAVRQAWISYPLWGEDRVHEYVIFLLVHGYGYPLAFLTHELEIQMGSSKRYADIVVLHASPMTLPEIDPHNAHIIVECKRLESAKQDTALSQLKSYMAATLNSKYGVIADKNWQAFRKHKGQFRVVDTLPTWTETPLETTYKPKTWQGHFHAGLASQTRMKIPHVDQEPIATVHKSKRAVVPVRNEPIPSSQRKRRIFLAGVTVFLIILVTEAVFSFASTLTVEVSLPIPKSQILLETKTVKATYFPGLYRAPNTEATMLNLLRPGDILYVKSEYNEEWLFVEDEDGNYGYILVQVLD